MSWESPITIKKYETRPIITFDRESPEETFRKGQDFIEKAAKEMAEAWDNYVVNKVRVTMDIDIDKYELAKALKYDRDQYDKGYQDGYRDGQSHEAAQAYQDEMAGVEEHIMMDMDGVT